MFKVTLHCSAADHDVQVAIPPMTLREAAGRGMPMLDDGVCLDWGHTCTGSMCPLFGISTEQMRARTLEYGVQPPPTPPSPRRLA